jgi:hypothetical protein
MAGASVKQKSINCPFLVKISQSFPYGLQEKEGAVKK